MQQSLCITVLFLCWEVAFSAEIQNCNMVIRNLTNCLPISKPFEKLRFDYFRDDLGKVLGEISHNRKLNVVYQFLTRQKIGRSQFRSFSWKNYITGESGDVSYFLTILAQRERARSYHLLINIKIPEKTPDSIYLQMEQNFGENVRENAIPKNLSRPQVEFLLGLLYSIRDLLLRDQYLSYVEINGFRIERNFFHDLSEIYQEVSRIERDGLSLPQQLIYKTLYVEDK